MRAPRSGLVRRRASGVTWEPGPRRPAALGTPGVWPEDSPAGTAFGAVRRKVLCGQRGLRKLPRWVSGVKGKTPPRKGPCAGTLRSQESLGEPGAQSWDLTEDTHPGRRVPPSHGVQESHMVPHVVIFLYGPF